MTNETKTLPQGTDLVYFAWTVAPGAYKATWVRPVGKSASETLADYRAIYQHTTSSEARRYEPLKEHPALFRNFADLDIPEDGQESQALLDFINTYGLLGIGEDAQRLERLFARKIEEIISCEPISGGALDGDCWTDSVWSMREAVSLLDALQDDDADALSPLVEWEPNDVEAVGVYMDRSRTKSGPSARVNIHPRRTFHYGIARGGLVQGYGLVPGDPFGPIRLHLRLQVNERIKGHVSARLLYDPETDKTEMQFVPDSLLSAMWLQFGQALTGNRRYRACETCGKWFEISHETTGHTKRRQYCSEACRMAAYRQRKERAARLAADGMTPAQIAKELDSDAKTVRGWIKSKKEDKRK